MFHIAYQSIKPMLVKAIGAITAFILSVVLARKLGVAEFGIYSLVISAVMVLSIPVQSGLPTLATREVSRAQASGDSGKIYAYIAWSSRIVLVYFSIICGLFASFFLIFPEDDFAHNFLIVLLSVSTVALTMRNSAILRGLGYFVKGSLPEAFIRPAVQLGAFIVLLYCADDLVRSAPFALGAFVFASFIGWFVSVLWQRSVLPPKGDAPVKFQTQAKGESWGKAALLLTVVGGGQILFGQIDTLMLGLLGDEKEVGAYRVAVQLSMLVIFALSVVNQVLQPKISSLHSKNDMAGMQRLLADSSLLMFIATLVPAVVAAAIAPQMLGFVFGEEYRVAGPALQILIFGQVANVFFGSVGTILNMTGFEKLAMRGMVIAVIINIALDVLLIPFLGGKGAALASALTITIWNAILRHYVKSQLGIESSGVFAHARSLFHRKASSS